MIRIILSNTYCKITQQNRIILKQHTIILRQKCNIFKNAQQKTNQVSFRLIYQVCQCYIYLTYQTFLYIQFRFDQICKKTKQSSQPIHLITLPQYYDNRVILRCQYFRLRDCLAIQRKEEVKNRVILQIPVLKQSSSQRRTSIETSCSKSKVDMFFGNVQDDEIHSPTFREAKTMRSEVTDQTLLGFSFGEHFLDSMSEILKEDTDKNREQLFGLSCVQCDSLDFGLKDKDINQTKTKKVLTQISEFVQNTKKQVNGLHKILKNYQQQFTAQLTKWGSYFLMIIKDLQQNKVATKQKQSQQIQRILQQLYTLTQRQKAHYARIQTQDRLISSLSQLLTRQKQKTEQLLNHLQQKSIQNTVLLQENSKLNVNLNKFMSLVNEVSINHQQVKRKNTVSYQNTDDDNLLSQIKNKENQIFSRIMRNNSLTTVTSDIITDSKHFFQSNNIHQDDFMMDSQMSPKSIHNRIYDSPKLNNPLVTSIPLQFASNEPTMDDKLLIGSNTSGRSTISSVSNTKNHQHSSVSFSSSGTVNEKYKILGKIHKLKQDIRSDILEMKRNSIEVHACEVNR